MNPRAATSTDGVTIAVRSRHMAVRVAIHAGAAIVTAALWVALSIAFAFVEFGTSVCGDATAHDVRRYRLALAGYDVLMVLVPLAFAFLIRYAGEHAWPWFLLAAVAAVVAVVGTVHAQPQQWCF